MNAFSAPRRALLLIAGGLLLAFAGCKEDEPPAVWNPTDPGAAAPVITGIAPTGAAWARITPVTISGSGFSPNTVVYFGPTTATILQSSATQLTVLPPPDTGSGLSVRVVSRESFTAAKLAPYSLYSVVTDAAKLLDSSSINAVAVDRNGLVYAHQLGNLYRLTPGQGPALVGTTPDAPRATCLRLNADGYLYMTNQSKTRIYRSNLATGAEASYVAVTGIIEAFDFAADGRTIYVGGTRTLAVVDSAGRVTKTLYYTASTDRIKAIRVYDGYVYVALAGGIWKNRINPDRSLAAPEKVFDWTTGPTPTAALNDFTFAANGDLYVATDGPNPILVVHPDGSTAPLYPGYLDSPVVNFMWGATNGYLYVNIARPGAKRIARVTLDANLAPLSMLPIAGAPYYGRD
jgi:sugar lactone lactonase YvrE